MHFSHLFNIWYKLYNSHILAGLLEQPVLIESGRKRERRKTDHLTIAEPPNKDKPKIEYKNGRGEDLGDIPRGILLEQIISS